MGAAVMVEPPSEGQNGGRSLCRHPASYAHNRRNGWDGSSSRDGTMTATADTEVHECDGLPFSRCMIAGAVAGMVEHVAMFPVDTIKTRMQIDPQLMRATVGGGGGAKMYASVYKSVAGILQHEGPRGLYKGVGAMALGAGPAHAVYFAAYEKSKRHIMDWSGFAAGSTRYTNLHPAAAGVSGALATVVSDAVALPMDVVKQRLQLPDSPYRGVWECVLRVSREEGVGAFFRSYQTTLAMNVPYTMVHFAVYEGAKQALGNADDLEERLLTHVAAGGSAGGIAAAITTPLDVVKTRLQTDCALRSKELVCKVGNGTCNPLAATDPLAGSPSITHCMRRIIAAEGTHAVFKGMAPRVLFHTPAAAICWTTYEQMKLLLSPK